MTRSRSQRGFGRNPEPLILFTDNRPYKRVAVTLRYSCTEHLSKYWAVWLRSRASIASTREVPVRTRIDIQGSQVIELELFEEDLPQLRHLLCEWDEEQLEHFGRS